MRHAAHEVHAHEANDMCNTMSIEKLQVRWHDKRLPTAPRLSAYHQSGVRGCLDCVAAHYLPVDNGEILYAQYVLAVSTQLAPMLNTLR